MAKQVNVSVTLTVNDQDAAGQPINSQQSFAFVGSDAAATVKKATDALAKIAAEL